MLATLDASMRQAAEQLSCDVDALMPVAVVNFYQARLV
jgi:hypothetical protein